MSYSHFVNKFNPNDVFRVQLTADQMSYLTSLLPFGYSLHVEPRRKDLKISVPAKKKQNKQSTHQLSLQESSANISKRQKSSQRPTKKNHQKQHPQPTQPLAQTNNPTLPTTNNPNKQKWIDSIPENMKKYAKMLIQLKNHKSSLPFLQSVDAIEMGIPEYYDVIKEPMDLQQIENKFKNNKYNDFIQFQADVLKIIQNSYQFNKMNEEFIKVTADFQNYFNKIIADPQAAQINNKSKAVKKKKKAPGNREQNQSVPLTLAQKKLLAQQIRRLAKEHLKGIESIVFEKDQEVQQVFDLQRLSQKKMRELQKYIRNKTIQMQERIRLSNQQKNENTNLNLYDSDVSPFPSDSEDMENTIQ